MRLMLELETLDEAKVAMSAVEAFRKKKQVPAHSADDDAALAGRIEHALVAHPMNLQKLTVLRTLLSSPEGEWVAYPTIIQAFVDADIASQDQATHRASAALRDLSYQMAHELPAADLAGRDKAIEVLASRRRSAGAFTYRLTPAGRIAAERVVNAQGQG